MYLNWNTGNSCNESDRAMIDWMCNKKAKATSWKLIGFTGGYACSQYWNSEQFGLLLAIWNDNTNHYYPEIEYVSPHAVENDWDFGGEGNGKHVFITLDMSEDTWYTMCIGTKVMFGRKYYAMWFKEKTSFNWILAAVISYTNPNQSFSTFSSFQEDYLLNEQNRKCSFRNALTHSSANDVWYSWSNYQIKSSYFPYDYTTWDTCEWNVCFDCDYSTPNNTSILLDSGSIDREGGEITNNGKDYSNISLSSQESTPQSYPTLADYVLPKAIQNRYNNKYVNTFSNSVIQSSTPKYLNFIDSGDDDGSFFITYGSDFGNVLKPLYATDGSGVIVEPIVPNNDWHKWKKRNASITDSGLYVIISPKVDDTLALTINLTDPDLDSKALCVKRFINTEPDEKSHWCIRSAVSYKAIRSKYNSNRFVAPSADRQSVVLSATPYYWLFVQTNSDEYYIMTRDAYKGIAINNRSGTEDKPWHRQKESAMGIVRSKTNEFFEKSANIGLKLRQGQVEMADT